MGARLLVLVPAAVALVTGALRGDWALVALIAVMAAGFAVLRPFDRKANAKRRE